jgi:hypothetical protein
MTEAKARLTKKEEFGAFVDGKIKERMKSDLKFKGKVNRLGDDLYRDLVFWGGLTYVVRRLERDEVFDKLDEAMEKATSKGISVEVAAGIASGGGYSIAQEFKRARFLEQEQEEPNGNGELDYPASAFALEPEVAPGAYPEDIWRNLWEDDHE